MGLRRGFNKLAQNLLRVSGRKPFVEHFGQCGGAGSGALACGGPGSSRALGKKRFRETTDKQSTEEF